MSCRSLLVRALFTVVKFIRSDFQMYLCLASLLGLAASQEPAAFFHHHQNLAFSSKPAEKVVFIAAMVCYLALQLATMC